MSASFEYLATDVEFTLGSTGVFMHSIIKCILYILKKHKEGSDYFIFNRVISIKDHFTHGMEYLLHSIITTVE